MRSVVAAVVIRRVVGLLAAPGGSVRSISDVTQIAIACRRRSRSAVPEVAFGNLLFERPGPVAHLARYILASNTIVDPRARAMLDRLRR